MDKTGILLDSLLFNPPFVSAPIEKIKDEEINHGIRIAGSLITAGLVAIKSMRERPNVEDSFAMLSSWVPCLFVHPDDHICCENIGYFQYRKKMEEMGAGVIKRLATQNSIGGLFMSMLGKESDPLYRLPSASLTVNLIPYRDFEKVHTLHQWWRLDLHLHTRHYR